MSICVLKYIIFFFFFLENDRSFHKRRPLFLSWDRVESFEAALKLKFGLQSIGSHWIPLYGEKSWNVFLKNLNFFLTEERKTWTFWMTQGWVNLWTFLFWKWNNPLKRAELLAAIVFWAANRNTAPLRYGRHKFESRLKDLSQSQPPSLSHFASCQLWSVLS